MWQRAWALKRNIYVCVCVYRTRATAVLGSACGLGASPACREPARQLAGMGSACGLSTPQQHALAPPSAGAEGGGRGVRILYYSAVPSVR
jgi:hypothetical protein